MLVLAALPAGAQTQGFVLGEGPGKLVDTLAGLMAAPAR